MPLPSAGNILFGIHPVREAVRGSQRIEKIYLARGQKSGPVEDIRAHARARGIVIMECDRTDLDALCPGENHQGVAAVVPPFRYSSLGDILERGAASGGRGVIMLLDGIEDPANLGSLIRTSAAWGVSGIIIPRDRAAGVTPAVIRISAGGTQHIPIAQETNIAQVIDILKKERYWIYAADMGAPQALSAVDWTGPVGVVIGGEGRGVRPLVRKKCDGVFSIPTAVPIPLNAAVSGATVLYEIGRQRAKKS